MIDVLHSIRSLISTVTNETPHERLFAYQRRSATGTSVPSWLAEPGPVLLKRHVRRSKYEPLVDQVELIESNPHYAYVRYPDGRETTVSTKHLSPIHQADNIERNTDQQADYEQVLEPVELVEHEDVNETDIVRHESINLTSSTDTEPPATLRRSTRVRKAPSKLNL